MYIDYAVLAEDRSIYDIGDSQLNGDFELKYCLLDPESEERQTLYLLYCPCRS
jgi:hypothetical protein